MKFDPNKWERVRSGGRARYILKKLPIGIALGIGVPAVILLGLYLWIPELEIPWMQMELAFCACIILFVAMEIFLGWTGWDEREKLYRQRKKQSESALEKPAAPASDSLNPGSEEPVSEEPVSEEPVSEEPASK